MTQSLTGQFLIAAKHLRDPNFFQSAVLVVEHNQNGAMGLVVNRPSDLTIARALQGHFELPETGALVFSGGPVEKAALFILHNSGEFEGNESSVVPGLYVGNSAHVFEEIVRAAAEDEFAVRYRIFAGCAGWGPKQLEREMARGDWYLAPASTDYIFHDDPYSVWQQLCEVVAQRVSSLPESHPSSSWN